MQVLVGRDTEAVSRFRIVGWDRLQQDNLYLKAEAEAMEARAAEAEANAAKAALKSLFVGSDL